MDYIKIHEGACDLLISKLKNKNYSAHLKEIILNPEDNISVKKALKEMKDVKEWTSGEKKILIEADVLYKSIVNEVYAYYHKAFLQRNVIEDMRKNKNVEFTWMHVTQYYYFFYIACVVGRLNDKFIVYLDESVANEISSVASSYAKEAVSIKANGTYALTITKYDEDKRFVEVVIKTTKNQHQSTWGSARDFFREYKRGANSSNLGLEKNILEKIYKLFNVNCTVFSESRNYYNYRYETAYCDLRSELVGEEYYENKENMWEYLINLDVNLINKNNCSTAMVCISEYLYLLLEIIMDKFTTDSILL